MVLKRGKARLFKEGSPIVYNGAVDRVVGRPAPGAGEPVLLADGADAVIGWGIHNPHSMFRVRWDLSTSSFCVAVGNSTVAMTHCQCAGTCVLFAPICRVLQLLAHAVAEPELVCDVPALLRSRIIKAVALRAALGLPSADTNVYRLINRSAAVAVKFMCHEEHAADFTSFRWLS